MGARGHCYVLVQVPWVRALHIPQCVLMAPGGSDAINGLCLMSPLAVSAAVVDAETSLNLGLNQDAHCT